MRSRDDIIQRIQKDTVTLQSLCIAELCKHLRESYNTEDCIDIAVDWPRPVTKGLRESLLQELASTTNLTWQDIEKLISSDISIVDISGSICFPIPRYPIHSTVWHLVEVLNVSRVNSLSDSDVSQFPRMFPNITDLNISHNPQLTDSSVLSIALSPNYKISLTSLDISCVPLSSVDSIDSLSNLHTLRSIRMAYCLDKSTDWASCSFCTWPESQLIVLNCSGFVNSMAVLVQSTIVQQMSSLRELRISESNVINVFIGSLDIVSHTVLPLKLLDIGWCEDVDTSALGLLFPLTPALEVAVLRGTDCNAQTIFSIALNCRRLQELHIARCHEIDDTAIVQVARCCHHIRFLDISWSLVTDGAVSDVIRYCEKLEILYLQGCKHLTANIINVLLLETKESDNRHHLESIASNLRLIDLSWVNMFSKELAVSLSTHRSEMYVVDYYNDLYLHGEIIAEFV